MPTDEQLEARRRRRAWWLRVARGGMNQTGVAKAIGLSEKSASTVGDWERLVSDPSLRQLEQLAALYGVPVSLFVNPPKTDEERLAEIVQLAEAEEREDWEQGGQLDRGDEGEQGAAPRRRSA